MALPGLRPAVRPVALRHRVGVRASAAAARSASACDERERQPEREGGFGVTERVADAASPPTPGSPVRSTFISPPIGITPVIGRA